MATSVILSDNLNNYKPVFWGGQEIYKYHAQLVNFLSQQLGKEYADLFAEPFINESTSKIRWLSDVVGLQAKKLSQLSDNEQNIAKQKLKTIIKSINEFTENLISSEQADAKRWGEIIQKAVDVPSYDYVFVEDGKIVLTAWGFATIESQSANFILSKEILKEKQKNIVVPPIVDVNEPQKVVNEVKPEPPKVSETPKEVKKEVVEQKKEEPVKEEKKKTSIFSKWWLWAILVAIIIGILLFLFCCNGNPNLPDNEAIIPPIDTTKIVDDPHGRPVISDQLILYIGARDKTVEELATDFKNLYPSDNYKVIYYNSNGARRINIQFPANEKSKLKDNLKTQLPDYHLVIVDEAIFNNEVIPQDPAFSDPNKNWSYQAVKVYSAWDVTEGSPDIIVAIIDDGFDLSQPEFQGKIINPYNVPADNNQPNTGRVGMYHGTHVSATAIGNMNNSYGLCGIAPNCKYMPIQVGDANGLMSTTAIIDGIFYAIDNGAAVINMSLGMPALDGMQNISEQAQEEFMRNTFLEEEELWNQIFEVADSNNVTIVLAAGNDNVIVGLDPMQRYPNTIKVSAVDPYLHKADFSDYGKLSTISAPGVEIYSALPNNDFGFLQGTSMAAPMVTGGVALIKSQNPDLTNQEIIELLQQTGKPLYGENIGNLMQLSVALGADSSATDSTVICPEIQERIDSLLQEIEKLKQSCAQMDTSNQLIIPDNPQDFKFATGLWKSTTDLHNTTDNQAVELYFEFSDDGTGTITYVEADGNKCYSDLTMSLDNNTMTFTQTGEALCDNSERYLVYTFVCSSDDGDVADCNAQTQGGDKIIDFNLQKVR